MARYIANVGLDYRSKLDGKPVRVEAGEEVTDLAENAIAEEVRAGNIQVVAQEEDDVTSLIFTEVHDDEPEQDGEDQ